MTVDCSPQVPQLMHAAVTRSGAKQWSPGVAPHLPQEHGQKKAHTLLAPYPCLLVHPPRGDLLP